jgi:hypothetical protein
MAAEAPATGWPAGDLPATPSQTPSHAPGQTLSQTLSQAPGQTLSQAPSRRWRRELVWALAVTVVVTLLGFPLGWAWSAVAPKVQVVMTAQGVWYAATPRFEEGAAGDGWFVFITAGAGVLLAIAVWVVARRYRGPVMLLALAVGSVAGAVIAAWFGHRLGIAGYERWLRTATVGQHFHKPADVGAKRVGLWFGFVPLAQGAVLLQAAAAVTLYTMLAGFHRAPSLRDEDGRAAVAPPPYQPFSSDWTAYQAPSAAPAPPAPGTAAAPPD